MRQLKLTLGVFICVLLLAFNNIEVDLTTHSFNSLFKIERSKDANQILYDVNVEQTGNFNLTNPINVYWIKNTKGGKIEPLTWIQKKYAYGLEYLNVSEEYATFRFVSYKKMFFTLKKIGSNQFEVYTKHEDRVVKMNRIYIQIDGGTFWFPNITAINIFAKDAITGEDILTTIHP